MKNRILPLTSPFVAVFLFSTASQLAAAPDVATLAGQPAELSPWAYAYRADLPVQEKPEAAFVLRRLQRIDQIYRPLALWFNQECLKGKLPETPYSWLLSQRKVVETGPMLPPATGTLQAALLWENRIEARRIVLEWPNGQVPARDQVELRIYPSPFGWFGWQKDEQVSGQPEVSPDGQTWTFTGDWKDIDMVAAFVQPSESKTVSSAVPQIWIYGPDAWEPLDVEIEWGLHEGTEKAAFDGHAEGYFGLVGRMAPLASDSGTAVRNDNTWSSQAVSGDRRGVTMALLCLRPAIEKVNDQPKFPFGHPCESRMTVWTSSGSFTFLPRDLDKGPIYAPEFGFFVVKAGSGKTGRQFADELAKSDVKSIRQLIPTHREATWEEATREITLPLLPPQTPLPPYAESEAPPMQVELPEARWQDAWRMGCSHLKRGELTYMDLALEAPRPIHDMDVVGLHDVAAQWLDGFLQRSGEWADGDFCDGAGNFCIGKLYNGSAIIDVPGHPTYELIHNGGTGRILYDLAEHYFLTGDAEWFKKHQWRMQAAAEWIIRQRTRYLGDVPNRQNLWVAGLHPPQHIADCAWGLSEWKWYLNIDAWYCQGLERFAQAMQEIDPQNAARYQAEARQYRAALEKAIDRAITLSPVIRVRNGTYRSYLPPLLYTRGPSIGQVTQIAMTDADWPLEVVDAVGIPAVDDRRIEGHLDVVEDVLNLQSNYLHGGNRYWFLTAKRRERGLSPDEDWFWGGMSPQLGYSYLANVYLRRDEIPSFLRQWVNNYAAFVMPSPDYGFVEHFMNHADPSFAEWMKQGDFRRYRNGHAIGYFMEQFRSLLVWDEDGSLWLAKATPRHWLEQGKRIAVKDAPSRFGPTGYEIVSDVANGKIAATVEMPSRRPPQKVLLRLRHPTTAPIKSVTVNGKPWTDFDPAKEVVVLHDVQGTVRVNVSY